MGMEVTRRPGSAEELRKGWQCWGTKQGTGKELCRCAAQAKVANRKFISGQEGALVNLEEQDKKALATGYSLLCFAFSLESKSLPCYLSPFTRDNKSRRIPFVWSRLNEKVWAIPEVYPVSGSCLGFVDAQLIHSFSTRVFFKQWVGIFRWVMSPTESP